MKIATTYTGIFPPIKGFSGGDRRIRDLVRGMALGGNEAFMLVPNYQNRNKENIDQDFTIKYVGSESWKNTPILNRVFYWREVVRFAKSNSLDAVLFYGPFLESVLPAWFLKRTKIKVLMEVCDLQSSTTTSTIKRVYEKLGERWMPRVTDFNLVISQFLFDFVKNTAPATPIETIPILVDRGIFFADKSKRVQYRQQLNINDTQIVIAYVGGMWKEEGVDVLIAAFAKLTPLYKDKIKLLIAGKLTKALDCTDVEALIDNLNIKESVILAGLVDTATVTFILNAADIVTVPQGNATFNKAGLPTKLAEYSAMGKAIVATTIGDVPVYFKHGENSILCTPSDIESLYDALKSLIDNSELRENIGKNVLVTAKTVFDYQINGNKIINIINKIVK